jgi:iron complex outermembrane receptor protein
MFRGNYNTAFRVPAFNQLFNGETEALFTGADIADPATCPGAVPSDAPGCASLARSIDIISGGNPDLKPETAKMFILGVVCEPMRLFSASVDYFNINRKNTIQILSRRQLVENFELFRDRFIRDSAGTLTDIDLRWVNSGGSKTAGFEIALRGGLDAGGGRFIAGLDGTYLTKKAEEVVDGAGFENRRGVFSFAGDLGLKWKHNAFIGFTNDDWNLSLTQIFRNGYKNQQLPGVANGSVTPPDVEDRVDNYVIYNASVSRSINRRMTLTLGVKNIFDKDPPFAISYDSDTGGGSSWEPRVADPRGRAFKILADVKF